MGKRKPSPQRWTIHLESIYRPDRDERIARAYELALSVNMTPTRKPPEEEKEHEITATTHRHLRARLQ